MRDTSIKNNIVLFVHKSIVMNDTLAEQTIGTCVSTFQEFVTPVSNSTVKVLPFTVDKAWLAYVFMGWEVKVMKEPAVFVGHWHPADFGRAINTLVAEYFGEGLEVDLQQWVDATHRALDAVTTEGYQQHDKINADIIRQFIRTLHEKGSEEKGV